MSHGSNTGLGLRAMLGHTKSFWCEYKSSVKTFFT